MKSLSNKLFEKLRRKNDDTEFQVQSIYICVTIISLSEIVIRISHASLIEWYFWIMWSAQSIISILIVLIISKWPTLSSPTNACGCVIVNTIWAIQSALIDGQYCFDYSSTNQSDQFKIADEGIKYSQQIRNPASIGYLIGILSFMMVKKCRHLYVKSAMIIFNLVIYCTLSGADYYQFQFVVPILILAWLSFYWENISQTKTEWIWSIFETQPYSMIVVSSQNQGNNLIKTELIASNSNARRLFDIPVNPSFGSRSEEFIDISSRLIIKKKIIHSTSTGREKKLLQSSIKNTNIMTESLFFNGSKKIERGDEFEDEFNENENDPFDKESSRTLSKLIQLRLKSLSSPQNIRQSIINSKTLVMQNNNTIDQKGQKDLGIQGRVKVVASRELIGQSKLLQKYMTTTVARSVNNDNAQSNMIEEFYCVLLNSEGKKQFSSQKKHNSQQIGSGPISMRIQIQWLFEPNGVCSIITFNMTNTPEQSTAKGQSEGDLDQQEEEELKPISNKKQTSCESYSDDQQRSIFYEEFCKQALLKSTGPVGNVVQEIKSLMNRSSQITEMDLSKFLITTQSSNQSLFDGINNQAKQSIPSSNLSNKGVFCVPKRQMDKLLQVAIYASTVTSNFVNYFAIRNLSRIQIDDRAFSINSVFRNIQHIFQKQIDRKNIIVLFDNRDILAPQKIGSASFSGLPLLMSPNPPSNSSVQLSILHPQSQSLSALNISANAVTGTQQFGVPTTQIHGVQGGKQFKSEEMVNDQSMVQHLLFNIFQNAVENTPDRGRIAIQIVRDPQQESLIRIRIRNEYTAHPEIQLLPRSLNWRSMLKSFEESGNFFFGSRMATKLSTLVGPSQSILFQDLYGLEMQVEIILTDHSRKICQHLDESSQSMNSQIENKQIYDSSSIYQHQQSFHQSPHQNTQKQTQFEQHMQQQLEVNRNKHRANSQNSCQIRDSSDSFDKWIKMQTLEAQKPSTTIRIRNQLKFKD